MKWVQWVRLKKKDKASGKAANPEREQENFIFHSCQLQRITESLLQILPFIIRLPEMPE